MCPERQRDAAAWFHSKWGIPQDAYWESMEDSLAGPGPVPQWYLALDEETGEIAGGAGVIENDFHQRKDLRPNLCALYVEERYRRRGIAGALLHRIAEDMAAQGADTLYLVTDHTSFYERYGWEFLCMVREESSLAQTRLYVHRQRLIEQSGKERLYMREIPWKLENPVKITEAELTALEEQYGFRLPEDLRQFCLRYNGGLLPTGTELNPEDCRLTDFLAIKYPVMDKIPTMDTLLKWQAMDGFIPMNLVPFCDDEAGDSYYIRVDEAGYGKIYYIFHEFMDDFLADPEGEGFVAGSFTEFLEMIRFPERTQT